MSAESWSPQWCHLAGLSHSIWLAFAGSVFQFISPSPEAIQLLTIADFLWVGEVQLVLASGEILFSREESMITHLITTLDISGLSIIRTKLFHNMIITVSSKVGGTLGRLAELEKVYYWLSRGCS